MALPNELHPLQLGAGSASAYQIEQSLRFNSADSNYMERTFSSSGSLTTWTFSCWFKHGKHSQQQTLWSAGGSFGVYDYINFSSNSGTYKDFLEHYIYAISNYYRTSSVYRDDSAWYHVVIVWDTTNATAADRLRQYINGVRIDAYSVSPTITQNTNSSYINTASKHRFGLRADSNTSYTGQLMDGYMAEVHFIDGTAVDPDGNLGEFDGSGVWRPIEYTGSYGSNGVYLKFDPSAANGIGHDHSGNGNNFTPTAGFVTTGTGTDVMSDTPTTNWCTLNPLSFGPSNSDMLEGNLRFNTPSSTVGNAKGTIAVSSGKWYWEVTPQTTATANCAGGILGADETSTSSQPGNYATGYSYYSTGETRHNNVDATYGDSYGADDVIGTALDLDAGTLVFYKNGVSQGTAYSSLSGTFVPAVGDTSSSSGANLVCNFGQHEFVYPPGTASATSYFNTVLYTGNNSTNAITGVGFAPDLVWIKPRSTADHHRLNDTLRGVNKTISSNLTNAEYGPVNAYLDSFDSDGFTVSTSDLGWNNSSHTYVAWCWKAGGTPSSNTDGSITASVSANQDAGFSIVSYTGTGTAGTVGHGLGVAPSMVIVKNRDSAQGWRVYHSALSSASKYLVLETTAAEDTASSVFNDTAPTSSVFSVGDGTAVNNSGDKLIAYCWTDKTGVIKTGSYEGNGLASGLSVDVGFKPAMVIIKNADAIDDWNIIDNRTSPNANLRPNSNSAEDSAVTCYLTPTGFTVATGNSHRINFANETFVYIAFAENFSADATYKALNTANLSAPTIKDGSKHMNSVLYTGTGASLSVTNVGFQPDWVWIKNRGRSSNGMFMDAVRGATKTLQHTSAVEITTNGTDDFKSFDSDGFTVGPSSNVFINSTNDTHVAWNWLAGNGTTTNTDGSITSTVSVNATAGFSIVSYTGTGANATVGHGLGVAPDIVFNKVRDVATNWAIWHKDLVTPTTGLLEFTGGSELNSVTYWNSTIPSSTTVSLGTYGGVNTSSEEHIMYCFSEVEGYSKIGYYIGNLSTDGPFIYCGFRPAYLLIKLIGSDQWFVVDSTRDPDNVVVARLEASSPGIEYTGTDWLDFVSNGFKIRAANGQINTSGTRHIFIAFAENPFGGDGATPVTAR